MKKIVVIGVIALFIVVGFQPAFAVDIPEKEEVEPKDYLFETIVEISNNPDVQELEEEYRHIIINYDFNTKYVYRQLLFKNPELLFSMVFSNSEITTQYLDETYKQGVELVDILGEEKVLEIIKSVEFSNTDIFDELRNIVMSDKDLCNRISTLAEMNEDNAAICAILFILFVRGFIRYTIITFLAYIFYYKPVLRYIMTELEYVAMGIMMLLFYLLVYEFNCIGYY